MNTITFRDMQNPDQPNLPFAQRTNATMFRDMQNPDQPDLPFAQSSVMSSRSKKCYNVTYNDGRTFSGTLTQSVANYYKALGYSVVPCSEVNDDKPTGGGGGGGGSTTTSTYVRPDFAHDNDQYGYDYLYGKRDYQSDVDIWKKIHEMHPIGTGRSQIQKKSDVEKILKDYYGDDIERLGTRITNLQTKVSEHSHGNGNGNGNGNGDWCDCGFWDVGCKINCFGAEQGGNLLGGMGMGLIAVGAIAYLVLRKKK